ncbi:MAG: hypothetical protein IJ593_02490, partial [Lachnospiraceae bacterium]|nr:hypothetical protein [Lachnospiraceae bacterium]
FYILAGLEKKPSRVRITKDDRIDIDIWGKKPTQETEKEYIYDYGIEDTIRLNGKIKNKYKGAFTFTGFEKVYVVQRDKENSSINVSYDEDYCTYMLDASEILLTPNVVEPNNTIVVRVPKNQDSLFDKNYGFMKTVRPTLNGNYYDYVVAQKGTRIYAQHFELKAKTKNNNNAAVWVETYKSPIKYVQDTFYFLGAAKPEQNIIVLTAEKADKNNYSISGVAYYEEQPLGSKTTGEYWQGASRVGILIDDKTFGYSNEKGEFITVPSKGKNGYYKRAKIVSDGDNIYKDIKLNQKNVINQTYEVEYKDGIKTHTERIYNVNSQNILISNFNSNHPKVNFVRALTSISGMRHDSRYIKINGKMTTLGANVSYKKPDGTPYTYTFTDEYDIVRTATESITKVEFLVVDPKSHEIKKVIEASKSSDDVWLSQSVFNKGKYNEYKADDVLYVRLTTDRKIGDGKGDVITEDGERKERTIFNETVYQAINTNIVFSSVADTVPVEVDFDLEKISPTSEELSLPVIGMLTFFKKFGGISFKS